MPILVKLIGSGVSLAAEAYASRKQSKTAAATGAGAASAPGAEASSPSSSRSPAPAAPQVHHRPDSPPPQYVELPSDEAHHLIAQGQAVPVTDSKHGDEKRASGAEVTEYESDEAMDDEEMWALDEAAAQHQHLLPAATAASEEDGEGAESKKDRIGALLARLPAAPATPPRHPLPCPVILPQRRPHEKSRGFVRAYAPVLQPAAGLDQATWLAFLDHFEAASKASPVFNVILIATGIAGFFPGVVVMATTAAINAVVIPAQLAQARYRCNSFLDDANARLFRPRGLYAMIVSFKPDKRDAETQALKSRFGIPPPVVEARPMDINETIAKYGGGSSGSKTKDNARKFRFSSGKTHGEAQMPEAADLVFPALDAESEEVKGGLKKSSAWLADYYDRRAQSNFLAENPDSSMVPNKPQFASSLGDPNHPAYQGGLVTLASGGKIPARQRGVLGGRPGLISGIRDLAVTGVNNARSRRERSKSSSRDYDDNYRQGQETGVIHSHGGESSHTGPGSSSYNTSGSYGYQQADQYSSTGAQGQVNSRPGPVGRRGRRRPGLIGMARKALQQDVLYLMVVNMPTEEEMAEAQAQLAQA